MEGEVNRSEGVLFQPFVSLPSSNFTDAIMQITTKGMKEVKRKKEKKENLAENGRRGKI